MIGDRVDHKGARLFELYSPLTPGWYRRAACIDKPIVLFFPEVETMVGKQNPMLYRAGQAICAVCPAREACLEWALTFPEVDGLWGGKTPEERRKIRKRSA